MTAVVAGLVASLGLLGQPAPEPNRGFLLATVDGPITPIVADYIADSLTEAESRGMQGLLISIDTPGGLDISMRDIVQSLLNATIPTITYVSPEGARAASAGTFITMAGAVAAMAPATSIGAATPVDLQGGEITDKIINDAVAFAVSVAERRGRDAEFAEESVREGRSVSSREAVEIGVVDLIADDLDDLLSQLDGWELSSLGRTLETEGATVERLELGAFREVLGRLADPNLAFILLSVGTLAIIYEAANPGLGFSGIAGVIMVVLAFFALSVLPVRAAGIALFVLGIALLVAELFVPGVGVLAAGGTVALLLSGLFLFEVGTVSVSPSVLWPSALVLGAGSVVVGRAAVRLRHQAPTTGRETLVGRVLTVRADGDHPRVFMDGTWWEIRANGPLNEGVKVKIVGTVGIKLVVEEVGYDV
jgi:membrane-bound serine protease (ClpP class)